MSKVYADAIATTEASQDLILGGSGDNVIVTAGATLKTNTVKDSGGNTLWTSDGSGTLSGVNAAMKGNMVLLSTQTASNAASVSFTSGIDSTYKLYIFKFYDVNPATDTQQLMFNGSIDGGSNYNVTKTTTNFTAYHNEDDSGPTLGYSAGDDLAQGTGFQPLTTTIGNGADESAAGTLWLFNPSNTTYVKHFYSRLNAYQAGNYTVEVYAAGYFNDTNDIDAIQFKMSSGNMDSVIKMYGVG